MVDWDFRKSRWDAYKLGVKDARAERTYGDEDVGVRFKRDYKDGYRKGESELKAMRAKARNVQCEDD